MAKRKTTRKKTTNKKIIDHIISWVNNNRFATIFWTGVSAGGLYLASWGGCLPGQRSYTPQSDRPGAQAEALKPDTRSKQRAGSESPAFALLEQKVLFEGDVNGNKVKLTGTNQPNAPYTLEVKEPKDPYLTNETTYSTYNFNPVTEEVSDFERLVKRRNFTKDTFCYNDNATDPISVAEMERADVVVGDYLDILTLKSRHGINFKLPSNRKSQSSTYKSPQESEELPVPPKYQNSGLTRFQLKPGLQDSNNRRRNWQRGSHGPVFRH